MRGLFVLDLMVRTGNKELAQTQIRIGDKAGFMATILVDPNIDNNKWALFDGDDQLTKEQKIDDQIGGAIRRAYAEHGGVQSPAHPQESSSNPIRATPAIEVAKEPEPTLDVVTKRIMDIQGRSMKTFLEIGRWLLEAKRLVGHGNWLDYLEHQVDMGERNAQLYMRLYQKFGANPQTSADLTLSKIALLLDAPEEQRERLIELARTSTTRVLRQAVRDSNQANETPLDSLTSVNNSLTAPPTSTVTKSPTSTPEESLAKAEVVSLQQQLAETERRAQSEARAREKSEQEAVATRVENEALRNRKPAPETVRHPDDQARILRLEAEKAEIERQHQKLLAETGGVEQIKREAAAIRAESDRALKAKARIGARLDDSGRDPKGGAKLLEALDPLITAVPKAQGDVIRLKQAGIGGELDESQIMDLVPRLRDLATLIEQAVQDWKTRAIEAVQTEVS